MPKKRVQRATAAPQPGGDAGETIVVHIDMVAAAAMRDEEAAAVAKRKAEEAAATCKRCKKKGHFNARNRKCPESSHYNGHYGGKPCNCEKCRESKKGPGCKCGSADCQSK